MTSTLQRPVEQRNEPARRRTASGWFLPALNGAAWAVFVGLALAVQPPVDPAAPVDPMSVVISMGFWTSMFAAAFGLTSRERWGYLATAVGGVVLIGAATTCFAAGHTGAWLVVQGLAGVGLATTGAASWRVSA